MKKVNFIIILSLTAVMLAMMTMPTMASYVIDGELDDWGVNPDGYTIGDHWVAGGTAISIVENWNQGPNPDSISPGVELCDIEAMYMDDDKPGPYIYFAFILSMPPSGFDYKTSRVIRGDLALDLNGDAGTGGEANGYGYEYGIKLTTDDFSTWSGYTPVDAGVAGASVGDVWRNPGWAKVSASGISQTQSLFSNMVTRSGATRVYDATYGIGQDIYSKQVDATTHTTPYTQDNGQVNYVIEMRIPKSALGISEQGTLNLHAATSCTNDVIWTGFDYSEIPEFTTIAVPVCMILGLFYFFRRKRQN